MTFKAGVLQKGTQPPVWFALGVAECLYRLMGQSLVVTSLTDSHANKPLSLHNKGLAADIRIRTLKALEVATVTAQLKMILDRLGFDVALESDHIHVEYQPKGKENWQKTEVA